MDEAIAKAAQLAKLGDERGVRYLEPAPSFRDELLEMLALQGNDDATAQPDAFAAIARQPQQLARDLRRAFDPERPEHPGAASSARRPCRRRHLGQQGVLSLLVNWLG